METGSTETPKPASGVHRGKYRRRPPTSQAEQERRREAVKPWNKQRIEFWKEQRAKEA